MQIFKLFGSIFVDNDKANKSISETDKKAGGLGKTFLNNAKNLGKFALGVGGAVASAGAAIGKLAYDMGETADRLLDLSSITGMSTDELQKWERVATVAGVSADAISNVSKKLTKQMDILSTGTGKAAEALEALGISYEELEAADADTRINMIVDALMAVEDPAERAKLGTDLLGGAWADLAPILDVGADRLKDIKDNADIISNDDLNNANEFRIKIDQMKESIGLFGQKIAVEVLPILLDLFEKLEEEGPKMEEIFKVVTFVLGEALDVAMALTAELEKTMSTAIDVYEYFTGKEINIGDDPAKGNSFWKGLWDRSKTFGAKMLTRPWNFTPNLFETFFKPSEEESILPTIPGGMPNLDNSVSMAPGGVTVKLEGATFINEQGVEQLTDLMVDMLHGKGVMA